MSPPLDILLLGSLPTIPTKWIFKDKSIGKLTYCSDYLLKLFCLLEFLVLANHVFH
ncbi:hypothetical protein HHK36_000407 [Tetracentron sinense]|uniref:Uncharacterized protein n=1 Tax=Tetracentron sinense TaxID=13715 RepID=A0A835DR00_TETSI|nr:hypothetical protein HHK36_000407 [Tetracentron sinense]